MSRQVAVPPVKRATAVRWWLPLLAIVVAGLLVFVAGCARLPISQAIESRPWPTTARLPALAEVVQSADGYALGTVEQTREDALYDSRCGLVNAVLGRCDGTRAHRLSIRIDDGVRRPLLLWVFVPAKDTLVLPVGTRAVFVWEMTWVKRLWQCDERNGTSHYCESDELPVVRSLDHVVAPADSALVSFLFAEKRQ